ncbi:MAG TPA: DUF1565 domain-containing protein [Polyangiaceae bacterium]|jgi:hypothetical protein
MKRIVLVWALALLACGGDTTTTDGGTDAGAQDVAAPDTSVKDSSGDVALDGPDPCASAPTTTFYVNGSSGNDANKGSGPACAFKTISAALAASASAANATIDVAAGTYGAGETFPLVVDHGRSLVGAGASSTTIQGASSAYNTTNTASFLDTGTHFVTILAGDVMGGADSLGATTLSGLTIVPPSSVTTPTTNYLGVVCIAGNAPDTGTQPPPPAASLVLAGLTVGPNFDSAIVIGSSPTQQVACNATITKSTFLAANVGVGTGACGTANPSQSWPSARVGDGQAADANTFTGTQIGVFGQGCGSMQSISANKLTSGYRGVVLVSNAAQYFEILGNTFDGATAPNMGIGIHTNGSATIAKLDDNGFANISESNAADTAAGTTTGYAMILGGGNVLEARRNAIHDNDNGVYLGGSLANGFDFSSGGQAADANKFFCNSKVTGNGYDLVLAFTTNAAASFGGNDWDHAGPSTSVSLTTSADGTDIVTGTSAGATTTGYGAAITTACATGRVH